ncbi:HAD family hydrolase [Spongisporangium articulatum]|uniref:HAD family hydrolase n=1 Tax=Spongisporangium articulatum TaxID=3362603 RepID=A0ABW8AIW8_9ACTN
MTGAQGRSAAFFDLDKTVIARSSTTAFTRPFHAEGLISRSAMLRSAYAHVFFQLNGADHDQMERLREYLSKLTTGWKAEQVRQIVVDTLTELIQPLVYEEATALIAEHHRAGRDVVLVSASGAELVEPIGAMLGVDVVVATRMGMDDEGRYSGHIEFYAYGKNKATAIRELAEQAGYDLESSYAYSDSATDLPMLETVGHPHAVNPDRALRREAVRRGWAVLDFTKPVALASRPRLPNPGKAGGVAVAIGAGAAATAGIVWLTSRRRDRSAV